MTSPVPKTNQSMLLIQLVPPPNEQRSDKARLPIENESRRPESVCIYTKLPPEIVLKILGHVQKYDLSSWEGRNASDKAIHNFRLTSHQSDSLIANISSLQNGLPAWPGDLEEARNMIRYHNIGGHIDTINEIAQDSLFPVAVTNRRSIHPDDLKDLLAVKKQVAEDGGTRMPPHQMNSLCEQISRGHVQTFEAAVEATRFMRRSDGSIHPADERRVTDALRQSAHLASDQPGVND